MSAAIGHADRIRDALDHVPANDRDTWIRMGMAIRSEFRDGGYSAWDEWSQRDDSYNARDARSVGKSIKADGRVTIGTLFHAMGVEIDPSTKVLLASYLQCKPPMRRMRCALQVGWCGDSYVLPDVVIGPSAAGVMFQSGERGHDEHTIAVRSMATPRAGAFTSWAIRPIAPTSRGSHSLISSSANGQSLNSEAAPSMPFAVARHERRKFAPPHVAHAASISVVLPVDGGPRSQRAPWAIRFVRSPLDSTMQRQRVTPRALPERLARCLPRPLPSA